MSSIAMVYVQLILKGKKTYAQVHVNMKEQVKEILIGMGLEELVSE